MPVASFLSVVSSELLRRHHHRNADRGAAFRHAAALVGTRGRDGDRPDKLNSYPYPVCAPVQFIRFRTITMSCEIRKLRVNLGPVHVLVCPLRDEAETKPKRETALKANSAHEDLSATFWRQRLPSMSTAVAAEIAANKAPLAVKGTTAGTDGGWTHATPLKTRYVSPTGITSFDGESAWRQYDPHILVPKAWGKQSEIFQQSLRGWPEPDWVHTEGARATWKSANKQRWPLHRTPKYGRAGVETSL